MRSVMVVAALPVVGHASDFDQCGEDVAVQHFGAEGAVEALDVRVLSGLALLDVQQFDAVRACQDFCVLSHTLPVRQGRMYGKEDPWAVLGRAA